MATESMGAPAAEGTFAMVLVWALRVMAAGCLLWMMLQIGAISDAADLATKSVQEFQMTPEGFPKEIEKKIRPDTTAPTVATVLAGLGAAVLFLAVAEMLKLIVVLVRDVDVETDYREPNANSLPAAPQ
jgi:hypothetical protein